MAGTIGVFQREYDAGIGHGHIVLQQLVGTSSFTCSENCRVTWPRAAILTKSMQICASLSCRASCFAFRPATGLKFLPVPQVEAFGQVDLYCWTKFYRDKLY